MTRSPRSNSSCFRTVRSSIRPRPSRGCLRSLFLPSHPFIASLSSRFALCFLAPRFPSSDNLLDERSPLPFRNGNKGYPLARKNAKVSEGVASLFSLSKRTSSRRSTAVAERFNAEPSSIPSKTDIRSYRTEVLVHLDLAGSLKCTDRRQLALRGTKNSFNCAVDFPSFRSRSLNVPIRKEACRATDGGLFALKPLNPI